MSRMDRSKLNEARRIALLWIGRLGDFIVSTAALASIRRRFPQARIALVVGEKGEEIAALCPDVDEVLVLRPAHRLAENLRLLLRVRGPWDLLIDLNTSFSRSSAALAWLARSAVKLAFDKGRASCIYTRLLEPAAEAEHMLDRYARLARALDAPYEPKTGLRIPPAALQEARRRLDSLGLPPGGIIAVHPGNFKKFDNRWPEEKFVELSDRLADAGLNLLYMAGPGEENEVKDLVARLKRPVPVLPPLPVAQTAALLSLLDLLVVNATGTAHLAAAVGAPTFSFLSGYTKTVWMPREGPHFSVVSSSWHSCRDIPVEAAFRALSEALRSLGGTRAQQSPV